MAATAEQDKVWSNTQNKQYLKIYFLWNNWSIWMETWLKYFLGDPLHSLLIIKTRLSQQQDFNIEPYGEMLKYLFRNHKPDLKTHRT